VVGALVVRIVLEDCLGARDTDFRSVPRGVMIAGGIIDRRRQERAFEIVRITLGGTGKILGRLRNLALVILGTRKVMIGSSRLRFDLHGLPKIRFGLRESLVG